MNHEAINTDRLKRTFADLVNIYSPSGKESSIIGYLADLLTDAGISFDYQEVEKGRSNLIIPAGTDGSKVLFIGHIDTVPAFDYVNYRFEMEDDEASGLGTADMKGGCAAMIEAFLSYAHDHHGDLPAALALVVGEEETGDGAQTLVEQMHYPWAIVAEPTGLRPCFRHFGYLELVLTTYGKRMHASLATKEHNAIRSMLKLLMDLGEYLETSGDDIIYNIRDMQSSQAGFVVPDRCDASVDIHMPPHFTIGALTFEIEELVGKHIKEPATLHDTLAFSTIHAGYDIPESGMVPDIIRETFGERGLAWKTDAFRSDSDAAILWGAGIKPVILGPGNLTKAHTPEESIPFSEVETAAGIYYDILQKLGK
jgi:acetylornithine deacetylase